MHGVKVWMRVVGTFYIFQFVLAAVVRLPVRVMGPEGTLAAAAAGDPTARLLVDTWITFGLDLLTIGGALLVGSRRPERARALVWTVLALESVRGIGSDVYMIGRGYDPIPQVIWVIVHTVFIVTGVMALRNAARPATEP